MIFTDSIFYFGIPEITIDNKNIPFDEGAAELNALIEVGSYTHSEFAIAIQTALNAAAILRVFTVTFDRATRKYTISADGTFSLLVNTGATQGSSAFDAMGFTGIVDLTGLTTYTSESASGREYRPQFKLQSYVDKEDFQESANAAVNTSANGAVEVVRFGINKFYEFDIKFITNLQMDGKVIRNNPTGLQDARLFMQDITLRKPFEFMPDVADRNTFDKVILDKIAGNAKAVGYKLKELFSKNLPEIYETGILKVRVVA